MQFWAWDTRKQVDPARTPGAHWQLLHRAGRQQSVQLLPTQRYFSAPAPCDWPKTASSICVPLSASWFYQSILSFGACRPHSSSPRENCQRHCHARGPADDCGMAKCAEGAGRRRSRAAARDIIRGEQAYVGGRQSAGLGQVWGTGAARRQAAWRRVQAATFGRRSGRRIGRRRICQQRRYIFINLGPRAIQRTLSQSCSLICLKFRHVQRCEVDLRQNRSNSHRHQLQLQGKVDHAYGAAALRDWNDASPGNNASSQSLEGAAPYSGGGGGGCIQRSYYQADRLLKTSLFPHRHCLSV